MIFSRLSILLLISSLLVSATAQSQDKTTVPPPPPQKADPPIRLPQELIDFFSGEWSGAGEFANGKKIEADVSFAPELDSQWLVYRHADRAPNRYKALGTWGYEYTSKQFVMILNDNFGGVRTFSSDGWNNRRVVFTRSPALNFQTTGSTAALMRHERFIFERQPDQAFKMTYEVSADGVQWRMGDYLVFTKKH